MNTVTKGFTSNSLEKRVKALRLSALKLVMLPDLVASRIACIASNLLWSISLLRTPVSDPFSIVMSKILPIPAWSFIFAVLAVGQSVLMLKNKSHSNVNFALVTTQTVVWIFLTIVFYSELYPGSLILANSTLIALLSSWTYVRFESTKPRLGRRWSDR